jgi:hypothetical protein
MQTVSRYLLTNLVIAYISGYHGRNSKVYDRRLNIFRGVSNPITFTFKNEDQKAQDITSKSFEFNLIDKESKKSVLTRNLTILDDGSTFATKGTASVTITDGDLLSLDAKFYDFSVREILTDGSSTSFQVTYADTSYNSAGTVEVLDGAYPQAIDSVTISSFTGTGGPLAKTSGNFEAFPGANNNDALHSIAVYTAGGFSGALRIQASMSTTPQNADFFDVTATDQSNPITFSSSSGVTVFNFTGVYQFVRFSYDNDTDNNGIIDKILYRH